MLLLMPTILIQSRTSIFAYQQQHQCLYGFTKQSPVTRHITVWHTSGAQDGDHNCVPSSYYHVPICRQLLIAKSDLLQSILFLTASTIVPPAAITICAMIVSTRTWHGQRGMATVQADSGMTSVLTTVLVNVT
jgi:hypothetical protein